MDSFSVSDLVRMTEIVRHRGPDDEGYMVVEHPEEVPICLGGNDTPESVCYSDTKFRPVKHIKECGIIRAFLGFGHRRLSIIDLSPLGHLPMCDNKKRYWITYNGEIYNYIELKEELQKSGYHFTTKTDTEVILAAYDKWGSDCQHRFIGMWAFAIYDSENATLFLSRDRFGIKPLYYWFLPGGGFCFASEIKQFTNVSGWESNINGQRASDYLLHSLTDHSDETMFRGVFQLLPGHFILKCIEKFRPDASGRMESGKWYDLRINESVLSFEESAAMFKDLFIDSVSMQLRADVTVGSALSGGLDSSSIVCVVDQILQKKGNNSVQKTFSSESHDPKYSEKEWMDAVINNTNVEAHFVYPDYKRLDELTPSILWHQDEPYQYQVIYMAYHVYELARKHKVTVMLNGHGSDEYISAYGDFRRLLWKQYARQMRYSDLRREFAYRKNISQFNRLAIYMDPLSGWMPAGLKHWLVRHKQTHRELAKIINHKKLNAAYFHDGIIYPYGAATVPQIIRNMLFHGPSPRYLRYEDRNSMAHSVEARVPFLDHRLVELCASMPVSRLYAPGESKRLLVHAMQDILPSKILKRNCKQGFITPEKRWVMKDHTTWFREKLGAAIAATDGVIKPESLAYYDKLSSGKIPFDYGYLRIILFAEWVKLFGVNTKA